MQQSLLLPDEDTLWRAFVERDPAFEGIFVTGVRTTGIFCRSTCPARKPRRENVEFFSRTGDALAAGYRPCQRCQPLKAKGAVPHWLQPLLTAVDADPGRRWTAHDVHAFGVDPVRVRRWFQAHHGMTFLAYLRARRIGVAFTRIRDGAAILETADDADFDSISGFCDALRRTFGSSAQEAKQKSTLQVTQISSPLGPIIIAGDDSAVHLAEFHDRRLLENQFALLKKRLGAQFFPGETAPMRQLREELAAYFSGTLRRFLTPLQISGSPLQQRVWQALLAVPYGESWSYGELAAKAGSPTAVRAVARSVGENRFAIVIPCHRIVGANGQLTGYGGGLWRKRFLLTLEGGKEPGRV